MIYIDNQLCYSPEPPEHYAWRLKDGTPQGPLMASVDRATGCKFLKDSGVYHDEIAQGLPQWNITFLLVHEADALPEAIRNLNTRAGKAYIKKFPFQTVECLHDRFNFARQHHDWLLLPPTQFMEKVRKHRIVLPCGADFTMTALRAQSIDDTVPLVEGNVVRVKFGRH